MEDDPALAVPEKVKARRKGEIMELQQRLAFAKAAAMASGYDEHKPETSGIQLDVLIDEPMRASGRATAGVGKGGKLYRGRTAFQAPMIDAVTYVQSAEKLAPGELVRCTIVGSGGYDLIARPAAEAHKRVGLKILR